MASKSARLVLTLASAMYQSYQFAREGDAGHVGRDDALFQGHVGLLEGIDDVTAAGGLAHHREGGILVGLEACQRVGKESDVHERVLLG